MFLFIMMSSYDDTLEGVFVVVAFMSLYPNKQNPLQQSSYHHEFLIKYIL